MNIFRREKEIKGEINMNYRQKRNQKGLSLYTVARELGVDYNKYVEVERGQRALEQDYVDKFQKILANATQIKLDRVQKMAMIKEEIANGTLRQRIKDYGYTHRELANELGLVQGAVSNALSGNMKLTSEDTMERIYDFINEPFNKKARPITMKTENIGKNFNGRGRIYTTPEIENWYNNVDLREEMVKHGYNPSSLAEFLGISTNHMYNVLHRDKNLSGFLKEKLYNEFNETKKSITKHHGKANETIEQWLESVDLKELIKEKYGKKRAFAREIGCTPEHLCNILNGKRNASIELKERIYSALCGVKVNEDNNNQIDSDLYANVEDNYELVDENTKVEETEDTQTTTIDEKTMQVMINKLLEENNELRRTIKALTKLIERL